MSGLLEGFEELIGAWQLRSCTSTLPDGTQEHMYGSAPIGVIMYTPDGWMSCDMAGTRRFTPPLRRERSRHERAAMA